MKFNFTITYPTTLDTLSNPTSGNGLNSPDHATQHADANDAIEALEAKVGVNGSAVTSSHDYKLSGVTGTDKAVSKTGTETLTNKTLTSPQINFGTNATGDIIYRDGSGVTSRLAIGSASQILAVSAGGIPEWIANPAATTATYTVAGVATLDADVRYYAADAGSNDTYVITLSPAPSAYTTGMKISFKANTVNTGAATINVNSLGAKTIVKYVNTTLADGDIAAGMLCTVIYDGTNFVLQNPIANVLTPITYKAGYTQGSSAISNGASHTITHNLGFIPRLIKLTVNNSSSAGGGGSSISSGNATTDGTSILAQGSSVLAVSGTIVLNGDSSTIGGATGNGGSVKVTLTAVSTTTLTLVWGDPGGNVNGTPDYVWEVYR